MSDDVHMRVGGRTSVTKEYSVTDESKLTQFREDLGKFKNELNGHSTQIESLEHRADSLAEWMGAIKDWVPQQTGGIASELQVHADRLGALEARELKVSMSKPVTSTPPRPTVTVVTPVEDPKKPERDWVHYFGEKHSELQAEFTNLVEQFQMHKKSTNVDESSCIVACVDAMKNNPRSRMPLWLTIGASVLAQSAHLVHYFTHLH